MNDYSYPSIYFSYFFFLLSLVIGCYFFMRSRRDGYWGQQGEAIKYQMLADDDLPTTESTEVHYQEKKQ